VTVAYNKKHVKFYRTFGATNNTQKVSKTMDGPQRSLLGTEQRIARGRKAKEMVTGCLQKGELPKLSLYCLLSRRWASQGWGSLQVLKTMKQQSNTKENLL